MKQARYIPVYLLTLLLAAAGCKKFVDKDLPDQFNDDTFWTSEEKVRTYCWGFYEQFKGFGTGTDGDFYFTTFTDDQASTSFSNYAVSAPATSGEWNFDQVRKSNILLERIDRVPIGDADKNHWRGIARFFRAFRYFTLVKAYGDVPWIGHSSDISETSYIYKPRDSRVVVMDSILADLDFAIANLRAKDQANTVVSIIAQALKSRVCLYEGTYRKYHTELGLAGADKLLQESKTASEAVMGAGYTLEQNYQTLYNSISLDGVKEVLLYKKYVPGYLTHSTVGYTNSSTQMSGLTKSAVESYLCSDGLPISLSPQYQGDDNIRNIRANRDKRLLIAIDTFLCYNGSLVNGLSSSTGYRPAKFLQDKMANQLAPYNDTDAPLFWLAEILLNYAEACAELDQLGKYAISQADLDKSVNLLRARAGVAPLQLNGKQGTAVNGTPFTDPKKDADVTSLVWELRRERRTELMMDGFRYYDILRWKKGYYMDSEKNPDIFLGAKVPDNGKVMRNADGYITPYKAGTKRTFIDPKYYLTPIPTGQISLYPEGGLQQNPGWE